MQRQVSMKKGNAKGRAWRQAWGDRAAVLEAVEEAREDGILEGVNFNSPVQTVVAGDKAALKRFRRAAKERKVKAIPLGVSTAFHSPMMVPAAEKLRDVLKAAELKAPHTKVYANTTADDIMKGAEGKNSAEHLTEVLAKQAMSPVYWEEIIKRFEADGVEMIIEVGPGKTLTGFTKKTCPDIMALNVENSETLDAAVTAISEKLQQSL